MSEKGLQSLCITLGVMIIFWFVLISLFWVVIFKPIPCYHGDAAAAADITVTGNYDFFITDI